MAIFLIGSPTHAWLGRKAVRSVAPLLLGRKAVAYLVIPLVGGIAFWLLRCRTHFLGDGWLLGALLATGRKFHGYDFVDYFAHASLFSWLGLQTESQALQLYAIMSVLAGMLYLGVAAWSARAITSDWSERTGLYAMLVLFPPLQMFMGYVESYSLLLVCLLLFSTTLALHFRRGVSVWWAGAALGLGAMLHPTALFLLPVVVVAAVLKGKGRMRVIARRLPGAILPSLGGILVGSGILVLGGYGRESLQIDFGGIGGVAGLLNHLQTPDDLLALAHWKDILNHCVLLAAIPLAMVVSVWLCKYRTKKPPMLWAESGSRGLESKVLLIGSVWMITVMSVVHMKLGIPRDWDIFAAHTPLFVMAACSAWPWRRDHAESEHAIGLIIVGALAVCLPWFWLNAGEQRSIQRFQDMMKDQSSYARTYAHEEVGSYLWDRGDVEHALREYEAAVAITPDKARLHAALGWLHYGQGRLEKAQGEFEQVLLIDAHHPAGPEMLTRIHLDRGESQKALTYFAQLADRRFDEANSAVFHANLAEDLGLIEEAIAMYGVAAALDPWRMDVVERVVVLRIRASGPKLTQAGFRRGAEKRPESPATRVGLALALWLPLKEDPNLATASNRHRILAEASRLLDDVLDEAQERHEACQRLVRWRDEIRNAMTAPCSERPTDPGSHHGR
jgi:tetratricopeptide (TPR) repeat protein